ncbi:sigma factor-like helix-turn-helix DNA-binding protein [Specibacter cremeus]|nr:sigma factor-like helix-turn-helix DNA-binding protein [Specibacter cremeus]
MADGRVHTLDEIGRVFAVTRERIRQVEKQTMTMLREFDAAESLREFP